MGQLLDRPAAEHGLRLARQRVTAAIGALVVHLDQQPALAPALADFASIKAWVP
jgi:hypothetical protein